MRTEGGSGGTSCGGPGQPSCGGVGGGEEEDDDDNLAESCLDDLWECYKQGWTNAGSAWTTIATPDTPAVAEVYAIVYLIGWGGAHVALVVGLAMGAYALIVPAGGACAANPSCQERAINTGTNSVYKVLEGGRTVYVGITQNW
jgi:hypothetical protein